MTLPSSRNTGIRLLKFDESGANRWQPRLLRRRVYPVRGPFTCMYLSISILGLTFCGVLSRSMHMLGTGGKCWLGAVIKGSVCRSDRPLKILEEGCAVPKRMCASQKAVYFPEGCVLPKRLRASQATPAFWGCETWILCDLYFKYTAHWRASLGCGRRKTGSGRNLPNNVVVHNALGCPYQSI